MGGRGSSSGGSPNQGGGRNRENLSDSDKFYSRAEARARATASHMPELKGSDKQVAWAKTIRQETGVQYANRLQQLTGGNGKEGAIRELSRLKSDWQNANSTDRSYREQRYRKKLYEVNRLAREVNYYEQKLRNVNNAAWWIDKRSSAGGIKTPF